MLAQAKVKLRREPLNKLLLFANLAQTKLINVTSKSYRKYSKMKKVFLLCVCLGASSVILLRHTSNHMKDYFVKYHQTYRILKISGVTKAILHLSCRHLGEF